MTGSMDYECAICKGTFERTQTDEEALKEMEDYFGKVPKSEQVIVCDDCYELIHPEKHPELVKEAVEKLNSQ